MKKRKISLAALTIATAITIGGCTGAKVASNIQKENNNTVIENSYVEKDSNIVIEDEPIEVVSYSDTVIKAVNESNDEVIKAALQRIINSTEDTDACILELENIYELGMIPRCATPEEWDSVIHLRNTIGEYENPFDVYYDLAVYVHTLTCEEEHYENEFGQTECKTLRKEMNIH